MAHRLSQTRDDPEGDIPADPSTFHAFTRTSLGDLLAPRGKPFMTWTGLFSMSSWVDSWARCADCGLVRSPADTRAPALGCVETHRGSWSLCEVF